MKMVHRLGRTFYVLGAVLALGAVWTAKMEPLAHSCPDYSRADIGFVQVQDTFTQQEYELLYAQTGLGRAAVDALCAENKKNRLALFQDQYFAPVKWDCLPGSPVTCQEVLGKPVELAPLEDGDILVTPCSHCLGWRNGHAALVLDAKNGLTLEAVVLGRNSEVRSIDSWKERPSFLVLRLKNVSAAKRAEIARYARQKLCGLPYRLTAGIGDDRAGGALSGGTQCAHLVWWAYKAFGYDLDSDAGILVTPSDLAHSPLLEVVQLYGIAADKRWPTDMPVKAAGNE